MGSNNSTGLTVKGAHQRNSGKAVIKVTNCSLHGSEVCSKGGNSCQVLKAWLAIHLCVTMDARGQPTPSLSQTNIISDYILDISLYAYRLI